MKDSKVSSNNENSSEGSTLKRFKTLTDLGQSLDTPLLTEGSKRTGPTTGIYPVNVLAMTPHSQAAVPGPTEVFTEDSNFANEIDTTQNEVPALQAPQTPTTSTFAAHLEENIKPKLEQWREYNKINKNKIPDEAIIKRSKIEALIQTVTTALSIFHGHPTLLDILHFANRIAVISEQEWKSVQEASMNETLTALNKTINALEQAAKSLQTTHNDTLAYWEEYEHDQLETLKKTSAVLIIEHMLGSLDKADTAFSEKVDASVEHAFKNGTVAFNNELDTLLLKKVKLHKSERFTTLEEKSKQATKAAQKAFNYSLHKLPTLKEKTQSSRAIQYIIPELFSESGRALKSAAADFDKAQYALKKPESTTNKLIRATYTMGKKTGSLLKSTIELMEEGIVERVISTVGDASHDTLDYTRTKLPSLAKRGVYSLQILGLSALKNWGESVIPSSEDSINFDATLSVTPLEILAATQDLLVVTQKMLASAHEASKTVKALEKKQEPTDSELKKLPDTLSREFKLATPLEQQLNVLTQHAIQAVMEIEREALTKKSLESDSKLKDKEKSISTLEEAKTAALRVAPHVQTHTSDEAFKALMDATLADIDPRYKRGAERKLISLSNTIKPAAKLLFEAATDLMNTAKLPTEKETQLEVMISALKNVENKTRDVKATIKLALTQMTGSALHNYSHRGLLAKDIGEFIASEKAAYLKNNPGTDSDIEGAVEQMLSTLQSDLTTPEDNQGKMLGKWIKMAVKDAENDDISWPASLEAILSQHPKIKQYLHEWGAKKFNYNLLLGMVSATAQDSARTLERLVSIHPNRNLLRPRMAYLKVLLAPLTIGLVIRGLGQATRVGENPQSAIKKFLKLEAGKLAFRLFTSVLPSAAITALSGALTLSGFYKGGKFNEEYLEQAKKRMNLNLVSAGIEQPFMLLKTQQLAQTQHELSFFKNTPELSNIASPVVPEGANHESDSLSTEFPDVQPLATDSTAESFSSSESNTERTIRKKRSVNLRDNTALPTNDDIIKSIDNEQPFLKLTEDKAVELRSEENREKLYQLKLSILNTEEMLITMRASKAPDDIIGEQQRKLAIYNSQLNNLSASLSSELISQVEREFTQKQVIARAKLSEIKGYYSKAVGKVWNDFDPLQQVNYTYLKQASNDATNTIKAEGRARLIDLVNGEVNKTIILNGGDGSYTLTGSQARTEASDEITKGLRDYTPGNWTKTKVLADLLTKDEVNLKAKPPLPTDTVTIKIRTSDTTFRIANISLDDYVLNRYLSEAEKISGLNQNVEITFPDHYTDNWRTALTHKDFYHSYFDGETTLRRSAASITNTKDTTQAVIRKLFDNSYLKDRLANHQSLKNLSPDSTITLEETRFNKKNKISMSLLDYITEGHTKLKRPHYTVFTDPPDLSLDDPLLKEIISASNDIKKSVAAALEIEAAASRLKIPTFNDMLQDKLDNAVIEKSEGTDPYKNLKLTDKVKVHYAGSIKNTMYGSVSITYSLFTSFTATPEETKEFTVLEIMQKKHERYGISQSYYSFTLQPTEEQDPSVLQYLAETPWQTEIQQSLRALQSDSQLRKDWIDVFAPIISQKNDEKIPDRHYKTLSFKGKPLAGIYKVETRNGRFEVRSLFSSTYFEFRDAKHMEDAFTMRPGSKHPDLEPSLQTGQKDDQFYNWLRPHMTEFQKAELQSSHLPTYIPAASDQLKANNINTNTQRLSNMFPDDYATVIGAEAIANALYDDLFTQLIDDADTLIKSDAELITHRIFQTITDAGPIIGAVTFPLNGWVAAAVGLGLATLPLLELAASDSAQESREIIMMALISAAIDYKLDLSVKPSIKTFIKEAIPPAKDSFSGIMRTLKKFPITHPGSLGLNSWKSATSELLFQGKISIKTANLLNSVARPSDFNAILKSHIISASLTSAHGTLVFNDLFIAKKGDLVAFLIPSQGDEKEDSIQHIMISLGNGYFKGAGNNALDPTLSKDEQIFTTADLLNLQSKGLPNAEDSTTPGPLTLKLITVQETTPPYPEDTTTLYIANEYSTDTWDDKSLWMNHTLFQNINMIKAPGVIIIKNSNEEEITIRLKKADEPNRWRIEWSNGLGSAHDTRSREAHSFEEIKDLFDSLFTECVNEPSTYEINFGSELSDEGTLSNDANLTLTFENSPTVLRDPLPESNGYWDSTLESMPLNVFISVFDSYFDTKSSDRKSKFNASQFFNFLMRIHDGDESPYANSDFVVNADVLQASDEMFRSRSIAGILKEVLIADRYIPPKDSEGSPFSKAALKSFLITVANKALADNDVTLEHNDLNRNTSIHTLYKADKARLKWLTGFSVPLIKSLLTVKYIDSDTLSKLKPDEY